MVRRAPVAPHCRDDGIQGSIAPVSIVRRLVIAIGSLLAVTLYGVFGYLTLGYTPLDAMYQSVMTLTTVGYGEPMEPTPVRKAFSISLMILGVGIALYNLTVMVGTITEGEVRKYFERRRTVSYTHLDVYKRQEPRQVADPVAVAVGKAARIDLIDDARAPPGLRHGPSPRRLRWRP